MNANEEAEEEEPATTLETTTSGEIFNSRGSHKYAGRPRVHTNSLCRNYRPTKPLPAIFREQRGNEIRPVSGVILRAQNSPVPSRSVFSSRELLEAALNYVRNKQRRLQLTNLPVIKSCPCFGRFSRSPGVWACFSACTSSWTD